MARGDGIARVKNAPIVNADGEHLPDGTRPEDLRGVTWPWVILGCAIVVGLTFGSLVLGAAWLEVEGRPVEAWLRVAGGAIGSILFAGLAALVTKVANGVGKTRRSQAQLSANQYATSQRVDTIAEAVKDVLVELRRQDKRIDDASAERAAAVTRELQHLREQMNAHGARIGRAVAVITGPQDAVPPAATPQPPRRGPVHGRGVPAEQARIPSSLEAGPGEADPPTGPLPAYEELLRGRPDLDYRTPRERRRGQQPPPSE